jgi:hypothetical protein
MRTVSEALQEHAEETQRQQAAWLARVRKYIEALPPTEDEAILSLRRRVEMRRTQFSDLACDDCGTELVYDPQTVLSGHPPMREHNCPGCGRQYHLRRFLRRRPIAEPPPLPPPPRLPAVKPPPKLLRRRPKSEFPPPRR